ncbi:MAG: hypothetical protein M3367_06920 [Acidobacteriota bacterium]|nr:hypothetical protein [Acidobacteriota bacterium]
MLSSAAFPLFRLDLRTVRATLNQAKNLYANIENYVAPKVRFLKVDKTRRQRIVHSLEAKFKIPLD